MNLPFTRDQFLDVFAIYHRTCGDGALLLWVISVFAVAAWLRGHASGRALTLLLVVLWLWAAVVYHAVLFSTINPAARWFALFFAWEAVLIARAGLVHEDLRFEPGTRGSLGPGLAVAALLYPVISFVSGGDPLRSPTFGVPCPTVLLTAGFLLGARPDPPRHLFVIPILWSLIGGTAATSMGIVPDALLFLAAAAMIVRALDPHGRHPLGHAHPLPRRP